MASEELKRTIAFIFQREGTDSMDKDDFIYGVAGDLDWFTSEESRRLLENAREEGLISSDGQEVRMTLDSDQVDIPLGFKPSKKVLKKKKKTTFEKLLADIRRKTGMSKREIMSKANKKQQEMNVETEVAMLLLAREMDIELPDKGDYIAEIEGKLLASG